MNILYDATPLLMRSAGVKNYHHALLRYLIPNSAPHKLRIFPFLPSLTANRNEQSNYPWLDTKARLGGLAGLELSGPAADAVRRAWNGPVPRHAASVAPASQSLSHRR